MCVIAIVGRKKEDFPISARCNYNEDVTIKLIQRVLYFSMTCNEDISSRKTTLPSLEETLFPIASVR